jgi:precorrin-4 methylase
MKHDLSGTNAAGQVTLVGAGPGDPELLTIKALKAIQAATVLMVDDLVNEAIVAYASPEARIVHVGKRGGCKSTPQSFIEKLMVTAALEGENVVRLKGGDPFIFGRGGEEVENLQAAGIRVSVINGIKLKLKELELKYAPDKMRAELDKLVSETVKNNVASAFAAMQAGEKIAMVPQIAPVADSVMATAGWRQPSPGGQDPKRIGVLTA